MEDFWQRFGEIESRGFEFLGGSPCQLDAYDVALRIRPERHSVDVTGTAHGHVIGSAAGELRFLLGLDYREPTSSSATIRELLFDSRPARYEHQGHMHRLVFPRTLAQGDRFEIEFAYETVPVARKCWVNARADWPLPGLGEGDTELCFEGYWLPVANALFQPVVTKIQIAESADQTVLFNGEHLGSRYRDGETWKQYRSLIPGHPTAIAGHFESITRQNADGTLSFYHQPGYAAVADEVLAMAAQILEVLKGWLVVRPGGDLSLIQLKRTGFGPYAPFPFVIFPLNGIEEEVPANDWKRISQMLAHEIGHFWFGALLTSGPTEQWLSEGFAQYFNLLYTEHAFGEDALAEELRGYLARLAAIAPEDQAPLACIPLSHPSQALLVRLKGAIVLHCLRQQLGWDGFLTFLKILVERYQGEFIDTETVEGVYAGLASREEARTFFDIHLRGISMYTWSEPSRRIEVSG